jgi:hypothetical protein
MARTSIKFPLFLIEYLSTIDRCTGKKGCKMTEILATATDTLPLKKGTSKRGVERYTKNPFVQTAANATKTGIRRITSKAKNGEMMVMSPSTGEIFGPAGFWQAQEVDKTTFVKLYVNGVKALTDLASPGSKVFELLYLRVQGAIGKDQIWLTHPSIDQAISPISEATFYRGMKELLTKKFIAESTTPGLYFLNPDYLWNGDRLAFVKEYRVKGSQSNTNLSAEELEKLGQQRLLE